MEVSSKQNEILKCKLKTCTGTGNYKMLLLECKDPNKGRDIEC